MNWLASNWIWIVLVFGMFAMHLFGHRGHGQGFAGKSDHHHGGATDDPGSLDRRSDGIPSGAGEPPLHAHDGSSANPGASSTREPAGNGDPQSPPAQRHRRDC